ncbi:ubiquinone biosynthesis protein, partial [Phycicoccus sp. CMS6Z-2]|nr:ubiquinone biosynthesis protein [Phycicoccus flavus]
CGLGGADIEAHPWRLLERDLRVTGSWSRWGGHVQVRVGTR